jgi:FtsH-binding integral membrane protein
MGNDLSSKFLALVFVSYTSYGTQQIFERKLDIPKNDQKQMTIKALVKLPHAEECA